MDGATINPLSTKVQHYKQEDLKVQQYGVQQIAVDRENSVVKVIKNVEDAKDVDNDEKKEALERVLKAAKFFNRKIQLEIERTLNITIAKIIDTETDEVIRQIPLEELVELAKKSKDLKGLLINKTF